MPELLTFPIKEGCRFPTDWLWYPYIALGKLTLLDGDPGVGKSFLAIDLAARLSRGGPLPGGQLLNCPCRTLYLGADDLVQETVVARLDAAGPGVENVLGTDEYSRQPLTFPKDVDVLYAAIVRDRINLVVIDPISCYIPTALGGSDTTVRRDLRPLADVAVDLSCAIVLVRYLTKVGSLRSIYRGLGGIGLMGAVRTALLVARHPDDPTIHVLAQTKNNLGPLAPSLAFRIVSDTNGPFIDWLGRVDLSADELYAGSDPVGKRPRERAVEWLRAELENGPRPAAELYAAATAVGIAGRTLDRAKQAAGVVSRRVQQGADRSWIWSNPDSAADATFSGSEKTAMGARAPQCHSQSGDLGTLAHPSSTSTDRRCPD